MSFIGFLNKLCTIQSRTLAGDITGQPIETWATKYANLPCRLQAESGQEYKGEGQILSKITHILFIDKNSYVVTEEGERVVIDGQVYNIVLPKDAAGHGHHWELGLEVVK